MKKTYVFAVVSILLWSTMATASKLLLDAMSGMRVLCISSLFAALFLFVLGLCNGKVRAMRTLSAKISNLAYITPFLSLVWTSLLLKERITVYAVTGLVVIILGICIQLKDGKKV